VLRFYLLINFKASSEAHAQYLAEIFLVNVKTYVDFGSHVSAARSRATPPHSGW